MHKRSTLLGATIISLILAYIVLSRALDTGSYWEYLGGFVLLGLVIKFIIRLIQYGKD